MIAVETFVNYAATIILILGVAACSTPYSMQRVGGGEHSNDATILANIRADLYSDPELKLSQINIESHNGVVQLSGMIDNQQNQTRLEELVRQEHGVVSVQDRTIVR